MSSKEKEVIDTLSIEPDSSEKLDLGTLPNGAIGLKPKGTAAKKAAAKKKTKNVEKVAVFSERNISWTEVGSLSKGYNIVTKEASEKWLTRPNVRLATPEEIAREYNI